VKRTGIFLIALALIVGITGCETAPLQHALTISSSAGGNVVTPGEGTFTIDYGTAVGLMAEPDDNFHFVRWAGDVGTIADAGAAFTTVTIEGDYTITAEFGIDLQELIEYELPISSTVGGSATVPGEGVFSYEEGTATDLAAEADDYYEFVAWTGDVEDIDDPLSATTTITMNDNYSVIANFECKVDPMVAAGGYHTVGHNSDGTVVTAGSNASGQCDVADWEDIIQVTAGVHHTVGLRPDGAVVAVGSNASGQCDVSGWTDIVQVAAGGFHTVGFKNDGTVVAFGSNGDG